jgi:predicted nucleic acid-binding protein
MKVLIDTNVALDILLNNTGFVNNSRLILELAEKSGSQDIFPLRLLQTSSILPEKEWTRIPRTKQ